MEYVLTPYSSNLASHTYWDNAFTDEQINYIRQLCEINAKKAQVGNGSRGAIDPGIRRSDVSWLSNTQEYAWIFNTLGFIISKLNAQFYRYDLTGFGEPLQLTTYHGDEKGTYGWHIDLSGEGPSRKLSLVLQLSDPSEYEGGHLEVMLSGSVVEKINKRKGLITVFPSWLPHQVTPVTEGLRQSLVLWVTGPSFR